MLGNFFFSSTGAAAYDIDQSLRFRSLNSAYLNRTPSSAGNRKTWTWSGWIKRGTLGSTQRFFTADDNASNATYLILEFQSDDNLRALAATEGSSATLSKETTRVFRDPNAWYHIVFKFDAANTSAVWYVNGEEITDLNTSTNPSNQDYQVNATTQHFLGKVGSSLASGGDHFDGYMAEVNFVDGSALEPTSFGRFDANNVWVPKAYSGSYGTNGFYLDFSDTSAIGDDTSGNNNDWTANSFELTTTTSTEYDFFLDTPTKNGAVWDALYVQSGSVVDGNRRQRFNGSPYSQMTVPIPLTGTTEFVVPTTIGDYGNLQYVWLGFSERNDNPTGGTNLNQTDYDVYIDINASQGTRNYNCVVYENGTQIGTARLQTGTGYNANAQNPTMLCRINRDNNTVYFENLATTSVSSGNISISSSAGRELFFTTGVDHRDVSVQKNIQLRAGGTYTDQGTVNTSNMPEVDIEDPSKYFNTVLYTGDGASSHAITGVGFQPDFVWIKERNDNGSHQLYDAVRGATNRLESDNNSTETTITNGLTSFDTDGFSLGNYSNGNELNKTHVAWCWKAGGSGSSNTDGTITSTVSASATSGFSIVAYEGNGTSGATVGHGLGVAPDFIIVKQRTTANHHWRTYHSDIGASKSLYLDLLNAASSVDAGFMNNTEPTSTVFSLGNDTNMNENGEDHIAYCFAEVDGHCKIGSYFANQSADGPFVYCGFKPAWVLIKAANMSQEWIIVDNARNSTSGNPADKSMRVDEASTEGTGNDLDFLSNGFKARVSGAGVNYNSGQRYIFMALAEQPFGGSNVSPATAR